MPFVAWRCTTNTIVIEITLFYLTSRNSHKQVEHRTVTADKMVQLQLVQTGLRWRGELPTTIGCSAMGLPIEIQLDLPCVISRQTQGNFFIRRSKNAEYGVIYLMTAD